MKSFKTFIAPTKIRVEVFQEVLQLNEATRAKVGRYTARRDQPHFQGDEYHGHSELPGGFEVAWGISGARRHTNKFPTQIPAEAREAVAKVLGVKADVLEGYRILDDTINEDVLLIEVRPA